MTSTHVVTEDTKSMGSRVFQKLSPQQRDELRQFLLSALTTPYDPEDASQITTGVLSPVKERGGASEKSWKTTVEDATSLAIDRRVDASDSGEVSAEDVVQDVLPLAHASVPPAVRRELFIRIKALIRGEDPATR